LNDEIAPAQHGYFTGRGFAAGNNER
jgi:hypothetical protein